MDLTNLPFVQPGVVEKPIANYFKKATGEQVDDDEGKAAPIVEKYFKHVVKKRKQHENRDR